MSDNDVDAHDDDKGNLQGGDSGVSCSSTTTTSTTSSDTVQERANGLFRGVALAPMVRASTIPLRTLALEYGADFVYTEELVDRSLMESVRHANPANGTIDFLKNTLNLSDKAKKRLMRNGGAARLTLRLDPLVEKNKLVCQLGTGEPELAVEAAKLVHRDVSAIDINMGCPKKFSVSGGMGSALLADPDRACRIVRALRNELVDMPVSCKIRLLKDVSSTLEFCRALTNAGANAIAIHGRRVGDQSMNPAHWDELKEVVTQLRSTHETFPILINGDFYTRHEWTDFVQETGASGVLLARPALYNTSIFRKPMDDRLLANSEYGYKSPLLFDKTRVIQDYLGHALRYNAHYKNVKYVVCEMINNRRAPTTRVPFLPQEFAQGRTIATTCACQSMQELCKLWNVKFAQASSQVNQAPTLPGEHRYEDSYFLPSSVSERPASDQIPAKRPRLNVD